MPKALAKMLDYIFKLPDALPDGAMLVHNHVRPAEHLGARGFRAWLAADKAGLEVCPCGWAKKFPKHYRIAILAE